MPRIRALVVDDMPAVIESTTARFSRAFAGFGWDIDWATATTVDQGQQFITASAPPFDLVIADLMFPREDVADLFEERGLDLIKDASERSPHTFILVISTGRDYLPDLMDEARRLGAHDVVRRVDFSTGSQLHSPAAIAAEIRAHLLDNGTVPVCAVSANRQDPAVQTLLQHVGEPTIARLYGMLLEASKHAPQRIELTALTPGASGAWVCAATAQVESMSQISHVLKLSRARDQLAEEASRGQWAAEILPPSLLVQHRPGHPVGPANGWYALGGPLVKRASTFRQWLSAGPDERDVEDVLEALLVDGMGPSYAEGQFEPGEPLAAFAFPHHRQRSVLESLGELRGALTRPDGGGLDTEAEDQLVRDVTQFVAERHLPRVLKWSIPQQTYSCYGHGDLHGGNVLVSAGRHPQPQLIDPSMFGMMHWATDPACLAVDLIMRSVDAGAESMFFTGFSTWRKLAYSLSLGDSDLTSVTSTAATKAALAALSWIAASLDRIQPRAQDELRWEWHAGLARQFLRFTYHVDIPPPKRALALAAAYDQLNAAATAIESVNAPASAARRTSQPRPPLTAADAAIITVLPEELQAVLDVFGIEPEPQAGQPFYRCQLPCRARQDQPLELVITSTLKPLNVHAGAPIAQLRSRYAVRAAFLAGIAGGRPGKTSPGDVVISQRVFYYEPGRVTSEGTVPRPQIAEPADGYGHGLLGYGSGEPAFRGQVSAFIASLPAQRRPAGLTDDHDPAVCHATIASGENVLRDGAALSALASRFDDSIAAVDQESYGFADSVRDLSWAVFRGISDNAGPVQDDRWKYAAAGIAAIALRDFLQTRYVPPPAGQ
ncbi:MAG TPA: phosphotransferase [Streptosporangiaceae bacterium]|jgi:nucleoside phosphorylase/CheY-like chemotaxis protein